MLFSKHTKVQTDSLLLYLQIQISLVQAPWTLQRKHYSPQLTSLSFINVGDYLIHTLSIIQVPISPGLIAIQPIWNKTTYISYLPSPPKF